MALPGPNQLGLPEYPHIALPLSKHLTLNILPRGATALHDDLRSHLLALYPHVLVLRVHLRVVQPTGSVLA